MLLPVEKYEKKSEVTKNNFLPNLFFFQNQIFSFLALRDRWYFEANPQHLTFIKPLAVSNSAAYKQSSTDEKISIFFR